MARTKALSNEEIIAALLQHGTVREAAKAAGTTARTIYDRMQSQDFTAEYSAAKNELLRKASLSVNDKLAAAIDEVAAIMTDPKVNAAVRLQAAQTIINSAAKFSERLDRCEKIYHGTYRQAAGRATDAILAAFSWLPYNLSGWH